jgi:hypothetical protein
MTIQEAINIIRTGGTAMSTSYLYAQRNAYITYEGPSRPMKLRSFKNPALATDWVPSPDELLSQEWRVFALPAASK